jgi:hypothetical protein
MEPLRKTELTPHPGAALAPTLARLLRQCGRVQCAAFCLTVLGWSLAWAEALGIVALVPSWIAVAAFALGLALIPFARGGTALQRTAEERAHAPPPPGRGGV